jgi:glycosyltransferase involved in cell wall biosynthesis
VRIDNDPDFAGCRYVDLPSPRSFLEALRQVPGTWRRLRPAVTAAAIVHSGVNGWPLPPAWFTAPLLLLTPRPSVIIVESAFWRLQPGVRERWTRRVRAAISERINRWCVNHADLAIFTQQAYLDTLRTRDRARAHVIHASWIDSSVLLEPSDAAALWQSKPTQGPLRLLFVGRLTTGKGVDVLLDALQALGAQGVAVQLDILGQGELRERCEQVAASLPAPAGLRLLGSLDYGPAFFALFRDYHLLVVPSVTDEQPRVVYDAYSQALPVIASDTPGLLDCVEDGVTGVLLPSGDPLALAATLARLSVDPAALAALGLAGLQAAYRLTHQEMHERRRRLLVKAFG